MAMSHEVIDLMRHFMLLGLDRDFLTTQFICLAYHALNHLVMTPRLSSDSDPAYIARLDRLMEYFPDFIAVMQTHFKKLGSSQWWADLEKKNAAFMTSLSRQRQSLNQIAKLLSNSTNESNTHHQLRSNLICFASYEQFRDLRWIFAASSAASSIILKN